MYNSNTNFFTLDEGGDSELKRQRQSGEGGTPCTIFDQMGIDGHWWALIGKAINTTWTLCEKKTNITIVFSIF